MYFVLFGKRWILSFRFAEFPALFFEDKLQVEKERDPMRLTILTEKLPKYHKTSTLNGKLFSSGNEHNPPGTAREKFPPRLRLLLRTSSPFQLCANLTF